MITLDLWVLAGLVEAIALLSGALVWSLRRTTRGVVPEVVSPPARARPAPRHNAPVHVDASPARPPPPPPGDEHAEQEVAPEGLDRAFEEALESALSGDLAALPPQDAASVADPHSEDVEAPVPSSDAEPEVPATPIASVTSIVPVRVEPVLLDALDLAALHRPEGALSEDDLMMLNDLVSSTEARVKREAKSLDPLVARLQAQAKALATLGETLTTAATAGDETLQAARETVVETQAALDESSPELQDLQDTLRAIASALAAFMQTAPKEWKSDRPDAEAINTLIRAKAQTERLADTKAETARPDAA